MGNCCFGFFDEPPTPLSEMLGPRGQQEASFTGEQLDKALEQVAARLSHNNIDVRLLCAGGYLPVTFFRNREQTGDIDLIKRTMTASERSTFNRIVYDVTKESKLHGWLNNGCELFFPAQDDVAVMEESLGQGLLAFRRPGLTLVAYRPAKLLATKLARLGNHDLEDAKAIFGWMCDRSKRVQSKAELEDLLGAPINEETFSAIA